MAITLTLGDFTFQDMEVPESIPFHSAQKLAIKKMVGGMRQIDALGPDPDPITWSGYFFPTQFGDSALDRARAVAEIRDAGLPVDLMWDELFFSVYIQNFNPDYRFARIPYSITLVVLEDKTEPLQTSSDANVDDLVGDDLLDANTMTTSIGDSTLSGLMGNVTSAIYSASSVIASAQSAVGSAISTVTGAIGGTVTSLVGAPGSVVNSILQPVLAAKSRVSVLSAAQDVILSATLGPTAGMPIASMLSSFSAISAATNQQLNLVQLGSLLGRITTNLQQINSSARTVTVSGGNLFDLAAKLYGDSTAATLIMTANGLTDPTITGNTTLIIPPYNAAAANGGVLTA